MARPWVEFVGFFGGREFWMHGDIVFEEHVGSNFVISWGRVVIFSENTTDFHFLHKSKGTSLPRANFPILRFFLERSKSELTLYLLGEGDSIPLTRSTFLPIPIPGFGDLPIDDGML
jgi:hypothetical protein